MELRRRQRRMGVFLLMFVLLCGISATAAFQPLLVTRRARPRSLGSVIGSLEDEDLDYDEGEGGVRLAMESAIKLKGTVNKKNGSAELKELIRYNTVTPVDDKIVNGAASKVISVGRGAADYIDPGSSTTKSVIYAPLDAAKDAASGATAIADSVSEVVINFLGGDDVQLTEVLDATQQLVSALDCKKKAKIIFNSVSDSSFPAGAVTVTVVGLPEENSLGGLAGVEKAVASGEIYFRDGAYFTVIEEEINTALA